MLSVKYPARTFEIGDTLNNGAVVLAVRNADAFTDGFVLAMRDNPHERFVTWRVSMLTGETLHGHYMTLLAEAVDDFKTRSGVTP